MAGWLSVGWGVTASGRIPGPLGRACDVGQSQPLPSSVPLPVGWVHINSLLMGCLEEYTQQGTERSQPSSWCAVSARNDSPVHGSPVHDAVARELLGSMWPQRAFPSSSSAPAFPHIADILPRWGAS